jgi:hypothetical protein
MREVRVSARKPGHRPRAASHRAVYVGPLVQVTDDFGNTFRRGEPTAINVHDWQLLSKSAASSSFLFLEPEKAAPAATAAAKPERERPEQEKVRPGGESDPARDFRRLLFVGLVEATSRTWWRGVDRARASAGDRTGSCSSRGRGRGRARRPAA